MGVSRGAWYEQPVYAGYMGDDGARQVYAIGRHHAMCYAPFGFEELGESFVGQSMLLFGEDTTDSAL